LAARFATLYITLFVDIDQARVLFATEGWAGRAAMLGRADADGRY
jgi:hypothetical protein